MKRPLYNLGEFEQIVLLAILRLKDEAYGVSIRAEIKKHAGREVSPGALFTTLERMESKGLLDSRMGDPTPERGGRAKRYYTVNANGLDAISRIQQTYQNLLDGLDLIRK